MKKRVFIVAVAGVVPMVVSLFVMWGLAGDVPGLANLVMAAQLASTPTVTEIDPSSAPNDLNIPIVITGTGFTAGLSGTLVITPPAVYLGDTALGEVTWVSSTTLHAVVPWGLDPAVYRLEVENPDGGSGSLTDAFTVTQGIGVWNAGELYGGSIDEIVIKPITPTTLYASSSSIDLFRSRDGGESWTFQFSGLATNLAIDPQDPNYIYMVSRATLFKQPKARINEQMSTKKRGPFGPLEIG